MPSSFKKYDHWTKYCKMQWSIVRRGIFIRPIRLIAIKKFLKLFRTNYVSVDLTRIGKDTDGGYLVPTKILSDISNCFSPGVERKVSFEEILANQYAIKCFLADASIDSPPTANPNFVFDKNFLGNRNKNQFITLKHWIDSHVSPLDTHLLLQMDIEGSEYDVFLTEEIETLKRFICIIVEFHSVDNILYPQFFSIFESIFQKLFQEFSICHVHLNNHNGIVVKHGIEAPEVFECTFLRNDYAKKLKNNNPVNLPHPLDRPNHAGREDLVMPENWWNH
ncbi:hypothetical protein COTS27_00212 [Spirochaetota bacterium]|nr:hypothetical protein COTS27_00212 [Spirochaetota bacterium]